MIILTEELENEISQIKSLKELIKRFTPEELKELDKQIDRRIAELIRQEKELKESTARNKPLLLKQYGTKPALILSLIGEDEVAITLIINGEENIFPETVNVCDGLILLNLISRLLRVPRKNMFCNADLIAYKGPFNTTPLTPADCGAYIRKINGWLGNIKPTPKMWPVKNFSMSVEAALKRFGVDLQKYRKKGVRS